MSEKQLIPAEECCIQYNIEIAFIHSLGELSLIHINVEEEKVYVDAAELTNLEKYIRLHYDLGINLEGIEAISHLLNRVNDMQQQMTALQSRLRLYETLQDI
jgi:hypothetical protein